jgi:hypothetical protein
MKKNKFLQGPVLPIAAVALLAMSVVGSTRAVFTAQTDDEFTARLETATLSVALLENDSEIGEDGTLLKDLVSEGESFKIGTTYPEKISVQNNGNYDEYVRVIITKSWKYKNGNTDTTLDPDLIKLTFADSGNWIEDPNADTKEQTIYYYTKPVAKDEVVDLVTALTVDQSVTTLVTTEGTSGTITTTYDYDGKAFSIEAEVDAVQTHSAEDAILGAWGINVTVDDADGTITSINTANSDTTTETESSEDGSDTDTTDESEGGEENE